MILPWLKLFSEQSDNNWYNLAMVKQIRSTPKSNDMQYWSLDPFVLKSFFEDSITAYQ